MTSVADQTGPGSPEETVPEKMQASKLRAAPAPPEASNPASSSKPGAQSIQGDIEDTAAKMKVSKADIGGKPSKKKVAKKREINPKFKDVQETGKWGEISTTEVYVAAVIGVLVVLGVILGLVFGLSSNDDEIIPVRPTQAPTPSPTSISADKKLVLAFQAIDQSDFTYLYQQDLPTEVWEYEGIIDDPNATPQQRAMSWLLFEDEWEVAEGIGERWALVSIYFSLGGENWNSAQGWLSSDSICEWEHISCDSLFGGGLEVNEIDLSSNNLEGQIPNEFVMLNTTQSLWLRDNSLMGEIPNEALGSLPRLSILYLDNNSLSGTISVALRNNGVLNSLFIQANNLTGEWPRLFCALSNVEPAPIERKGLDCDEVVCLQDGCCDEYSCFYDEE